MSVFILGSCRIWNTLEKIESIEISNKNFRTLMHGIGQYIQEIEFIKRTKEIPSELLKYMYYNNYAKLLTEKKEDTLKKIIKCYNDSKFIIAEMQTLKYIESNGYQLDLIQCNRNNPEDENVLVRKDENDLDTEIKVYGKVEFIDLVKKFIMSIKHKKIIFIGHLYSPKPNIKKINQRLIINNIVNKICDNNKTYFINPSKIFEIYEWDYIMKDSQHYTEEGEIIVSEYIYAEMNRIMSNFEST